MTVTVHVGDCRDVLKGLASESVNCIVTSPPYFGLRDYGVADQIGLEPTPDAFVSELVSVFREARRVLRDDGTLWLNLGDSYAGSGKGGNPDPGSSKQATNKGSQTVGSLYGTGKTAREAAVTNVTRKDFPDLGIKPKDLIGIPWRVAFALQADGWYLRQDIIWHKPNPMPESVTDRCTKSHEYLFLLSKSPRYWYDAQAIKEAAVAEDIGAMDGGSQRLPDGSNANGGRNYRGHLPGNKSHKGLTAYEGGATERRTKAGLVAYSTKVGTDPSHMLTRNKRSVWTVATQPFADAHFATFPPALIEPCILAGAPVGGTVLDPFGGAGTTGLVADRLGRNAVLIELNPEYAAMSRSRINDDGGMFGAVA